MSLLPAGVVKVEGDFAAGDPVDLCAPTGVAVARGLVNYDAGRSPTCSAAPPGSWPAHSARSTSVS